MSEMQTDQPKAQAMDAPAEPKQQKQQGMKRFRVRSNYFLPNDLVWIHPPGLPYWPAEVIESDEPNNRVRARLILPPKAELLVANLKEEERVWGKARQRHGAQQAAKRPKCETHEGTGDRGGSSSTASASAESAEFAMPELEADVVTSVGGLVHFFDKLATAEELEECIADRLGRTTHDVSAYEAEFMKAVMAANKLVRTVLSPENLRPYEVRGVGVVHSLMRSHIAAPRQPHTGTFEPQTAVIRLRRGLGNATRDLEGFDYVWVLFQFSYAAAFATGEGQAYVRKMQKGEAADAPDGDVAPEGKASEDVGLRWRNRQGLLKSKGFKTLIVPPRDEELRGVFATRSPHRPNFIGLSCVRLVKAKGLEVHIADHDLLHGTPVLDIKPYLPFCDAHQDARAGWVEALDKSGKSKGDHKVAQQTRQVDRVFVPDGAQ